MFQTVVELTERQDKALKMLAGTYRVTVEDLIRRSIDKFIESTPLDMAERRRRALSIVGRYHSGIGDLSIEHDKYLGDSYAE
jgi:hypothetical protein